MKANIVFYIVLMFMIGCSKPIPQKEEYLGVYRIIKIIENNETITFSTLAQIEITENLYISSIDRDEDNKFSLEEISTGTYLFNLAENNEPYISITGNDSILRLLPGNYYDLLIKRVDNAGKVTTLYLKKVR